MRIQLISHVMIGLLSVGYIQLTQAQEDLLDVGSSGADGELRFYAPPPSAEGDDLSTAYDSHRNIVVRFDGLTGLTWEFDGDKWTGKNTQSTPTTGMEGRKYGSMAYDPTRQRIVYFGGLDAQSNVPYADTWEYDGQNWQAVQTLNSPPARENGLLVFDSTNEFLLLAGGTNMGARYSDTWVYDGENWIEQSSLQSYSASTGARMAYDSARGVAVLASLANLWEWDGENWVAKPNNGAKPSVNQDQLVYHPQLQRVLAFEDTRIKAWDGTNWKELEAGGPNLHDDPVVFLNQGNQILALDGQTTYLRNQSGWSTPPLLGPIATFDMSNRANGIYNYSTITVPSGVQVNFIPNNANTPVHWLAQEDVLIEGILNLNGEDGRFSSELNDQPFGGPGGGRGGRGGVRFDISGNYAGSPGEGPGGGPAGLTAKQCGGYASFAHKQVESCSSRGWATRLNTSGEPYGNSLLRPLQGGSGGGGSASSENLNGASGGGGGGAILIATDKIITLTGGVFANGGDREQYGQEVWFSGRGSGGAIRLVASRIEGDGVLEAKRMGRIRTEAFYLSQAISRDTSGGIKNGTSLPLAEGRIIEQPAEPIQILTVDGVPVASPPAGDLNSVDVVFESESEIIVELLAPGIPSENTITLTIYATGQVITAESTPLDENGEARVFVSVPAGIGKMIATASYVPAVQ